MKFTAVIASTAIFLAPAVNAWTQDKAGVWVANNNFYEIRGSIVHESCTTMNTQDVHAAGDYCAYWINGIGQKYKGHCKKTGNSVFCD